MIHVFVPDSSMHNHILAKFKFGSHERDSTFIVSIAFCKERNKVAYFFTSFPRDCRAVIFFPNTNQFTVQCMSFFFQFNFVFQIRLLDPRVQYQAYYQQLSGWSRRINNVQKLAICVAVLDILEGLEEVLQGSPLAKNQVSYFSYETFFPLYLKQITSRPYARIITVQAYF